MTRKADNALPIEITFPTFSFKMSHNGQYYLKKLEKKKPPLGRAKLINFGFGNPRHPRSANLRINRQNQPQHLNNLGTSRMLITTRSWLYYALNLLKQPRKMMTRLLRAITHGHLCSLLTKTKRQMSVMCSVKVKMKVVSQQVLKFLHVLFKLSNHHC